jgi:hypothetical protein
MMEKTYYSKISIDFEYTAQHYIPGDKLFNDATPHKQH